VRLASAILAATLTTCVAGFHGRAAAEIARSITNGTVDDGDPAVVALLSSGRAYCTGTVIAGRWVLTAAHCLQPAMSPSEVYIGGSPAAGGARLEIVRVIVHPQFSELGLQNDVGLVEIAGAAPVTPLPLMQKPLDEASVGSLVRLVGFGSSSDTDRDAALKRSGTARVSAVDQQKLTLEPAPSEPCLTDSGAPVLEEIDGLERVVGVTSSGDARCASYARAARVDAFVDGFILPAIDGPQTSGCGQAPDGAPGASLLVLGFTLLRTRGRGRSMLRARGDDDDRRPETRRTRDDPCPPAHGPRGR
jgi:secreted trypsin-like serine protease